MFEFNHMWKNNLLLFFFCKFIIDFFSFLGALWKEPHSCTFINHSLKHKVAILAVLKTYLLISVRLEAYILQYQWQQKLSQMFFKDFT